METKTTRFVAQFSRAVFQQWTQTADRQQFWRDDAFLHNLLEEAVAKLPRGELKTQLTRDLRSLEVLLASLLRELHVDYVKTQQQEEQRAPSSLAHGALLNEELTELELTQAAAATSSDRQHQLAGILALDSAIVGPPHPTDEQQQQELEKLVETFALIAARSYETPLEQTHKRGLVLQKLAVCVQQKLEKLCSSNWQCSEESEVGKQVQQLRVLLERVVVQDAVKLARVATAAEDGNTVSVGLAAPWTSFYRPEENKELQKVEFDNEMAKIYGALLALAVYFPIESDDEIDSEMDEETSGDSSSDEDEMKASNQTPKLPRKLDAIAQAEFTTRKVLFASQMRQCGVHQNGQWLVAVLSYLQSLPKPTTYLDEDEDEIFSTQDRRALLDCLGEVFTRAFANTAIFDQAKDVHDEEKVVVQDRALFDAVVCLRHAASFMRVERKCSLPAITTAMTSLAGVPLPASFVSWLDAEQTVTPSSMVEKATQRLWKICEGQSKMANVLLSLTNVTAEELSQIQKVSKRLAMFSYFAHLQHVAEGTLAKSSITHTNAAIYGSAKEASADNSSLFFVDNAGGDNNEATSSKSKKKRENKKKRRANKGKSSRGAVEVGESSPAKRIRVSVSSS
ncbi:Vacuolar protein sorting-associated protein 13A [Phytophthora boehmeriae]|uniref:Vacuolar protein sorting-associated protein 13A n=1 Tax=Phytophthora boehmeriae TaxID=109152 RepID=A0A8T1W834_9STRA|nr:Vacuolar protein sorting-associated protein 13A [Phytophthora boehmeriae]